MTKPNENPTRALTRRQILFSMPMAAALPWLGGLAQAGSKAKQGVMIPMPSMPWPDAKRIVGDQNQLSEAEKTKGWEAVSPFYNDFSLIQDRTGRWHCMGHIFWKHGSGIFHAVSDLIDGKYTLLAPLWTRYERFDTGVLEMISPSAFWKDERTAFMVAGHSGLNDSSIRVWESVDPKLESWTLKIDPETERPFEFSHESGVRDPEVFWDEKRRRYILYYVIGDGWRVDEADNVLRARTSTDLLHWSDAQTLMPPPPGYKNAESIFVIERDGLYYLWVCGFDYGRMSLYISEDPLNFGDPVSNRIMEQSGHAPQIIHADGEYWMACVAVASQFGNAPAVHDLPGVYIQKMKWIEADDEAIKKIVRRK